jgi:hypothetical protein
MASSAQIVPPENGPNGTTTGARDQSGENRLYKLDSRSLPFFIRYMRRDLKSPPKPKERDMGFIETYFASERGDNNYMNRPFIDYLSHLTEKIRSFYCMSGRDIYYPFQDFEVDRSVYTRIVISSHGEIVNEHTDDIEDASKQLFKAFSTGKDIVYTLNLVSGRTNNDLYYRPQTAPEIDETYHMERLNELVNLYYEALSNITETQTYVDHASQRVTSAETNFSSTNTPSPDEGVDDWETLADEPCAEEVELKNARAALLQAQFDLSNAELKKTNRDNDVRNFIQMISSSNYVQDGKIKFFKNFIAQLRSIKKREYIKSILPTFYLKKLNK